MREVSAEAQRREGFAHAFDAAAGAEVEFLIEIVRNFDQAVQLSGSLDAQAAVVVIDDDFAVGI